MPLPSTQHTLCPLQFPKFPPFRLLSSVICHFLPPRNFPHPPTRIHTPSDSVPCQSCRVVGAQSSSPVAGGRNLPMRTTDTRVASLASPALAMQTLREAGVAKKRLVGFGSLILDSSAHRCGEGGHGAARLPPHTLVMWWNALQLMTTVCGHAAQVLHAWLVPVNHIASFIAISPAAIREEIALPSVQLCLPRGSPARLDAWWCSCAAQPVQPSGSGSSPNSFQIPCVR